MTVTKTRNLNLSHSGDGAGDFEPLVRAAARGDGRAVERLLMRAQEVAFRFSLLVCGHPEDAEDVMQDALLKTYRYVGRIRRPEAFRTWLYRTVRNACLIKRRRRVDEPATMLSLDAADSAGDAPTLEVADRRKGPHEAAINAWLGRRLREALEALPPGHRVVVLLRDIEGLSTRDVATVLGMSEDNVKTRLHRARVLLREQLGDV
jgi:RNA polymerase sigma-70 factor (ECF subfamily)